MVEKKKKVVKKTTKTSVKATASEKGTRKKVSTSKKEETKVATSSKKVTSKSIASKKEKEEVKVAVKKSTNTSAENKRESTERSKEKTPQRHTNLVSALKSDNDKKQASSFSSGQEGDKDKAKTKNQEGRKDSGKNFDKPKRQANTDDIIPEDEFDERVVVVNRVAKVVKGGRRFSFSALIVVGNKKGRVGYGLGKAKEVPDAMRKASQIATKHTIEVPIENGTIPHEVLGTFDAGKILFKPASEGTGIKAGGSCRAILELVGIKDILTKSLRGDNPHNIVKATFSALKQLRSPESIANSRGKKSKGLRIKQ